MKKVTGWVELFNDGLSNGGLPSDMSWLGMMNETHNNKSIDEVFDKFKVCVHCLKKNNPLPTSRPAAKKGFVFGWRRQTNAHSTFETTSIWPTIKGCDWGDLCVAGYLTILRLGLYILISLSGSYGWHVRSFVERSSFAKALTPMVGRTISKSLEQCRFTCVQFEM